MKRRWSRGCTASSAANMSQSSEVISFPFDLVMGFEWATLTPRSQ
jgi:hypothetical protein